MDSALEYILKYVMELPDSSPVHLSLLEHHIIDISSLLKLDFSDIKQLTYNSGNNDKDKD